MMARVRQTGHDGQSDAGNFKRLQGILMPIMVMTDATVIDMINLGRSQRLLCDANEDDASSQSDDARW